MISRLAANQTPPTQPTTTTTPTHQPGIPPTPKPQNQPRQLGAIPKAKPSAKPSKKKKIPDITGMKDLRLYFENKGEKIENVQTNAILETVGDQPPSDSQNQILFLTSPLRERAVVNKNCSSDRQLIKCERENKKTSPREKLI